MNVRCSDLHHPYDRCLTADGDTKKELRPHESKRTHGQSMCDACAALVCGWSCFTSTAYFTASCRPRQQATRRSCDRTLALSSDHGTAGHESQCWCQEKIGFAVLPFAARAQGRCGREERQLEIVRYRGRLFAGVVSNSHKLLPFSLHYACTIVRSAAGEGRSFFL